MKSAKTLNNYKKRLNKRYHIGRHDKLGERIGKDNSITAKKWYKQPLQNAYRVFNYYLNGNPVADQWKVAYISSIFKKLETIVAFRHWHYKQVI